MEYIGTFFGPMTEGEVEWLNKKLAENGWDKTVAKLKGVPIDHYIDKDGEKQIKVADFFRQFIDMRRLEGKTWREVCAATQDDDEREELMRQRFTAI